MSEFKRTRGSDGVRKRAKREVLMEKKKKKRVMKNVKR